MTDSFYYDNLVLIPLMTGQEIKEVELELEDQGHKFYEIAMRLSIRKNKLKNEAGNDNAD